MTSAHQIRPAVAADEATIRACAQEAFARYVGAIGRKPAPMVADFAALIREGHVHVAERDAEVIGFIAFYQEDGAVMLDNIAVRVSAAGQGVGKALIAFCEDQARRSGSEAVRVYTNAKMTENLSIYPHLGYAETGRRREDGFDRVYFEKRL